MGDAGAVEHTLATNLQAARPSYLCHLKDFPAAHRRLCPSPGDVESATMALDSLPLLRASREGQKTLALRLLSERACVHQASPTQSCTALSLAAESGHVELVEALMSARADPNC